MENRNLQWNKRVKVPLILIFSVNTNHESVAYRSFSPSKFEARGARKVTTGCLGVKELFVSCCNTARSTICVNHQVILINSQPFFRVHRSSGDRPAPEGASLRYDRFHQS